MLAVHRLHVVAFTIVSAVLQPLALHFVAAFGFAGGGGPVALPAAAAAAAAALEAAAVAAASTVAVHAWASGVRWLPQNHSPQAAHLYGRKSVMVALGTA